MNAKGIPDFAVADWAHVSTTAVYQPPRCRSCAAILQPPGHACDACGTSQAVPAAQPIVGAKSAGVAVLLSFLWLGAGHLYANKLGVGIPLMIFNGLLVLLSLTGIGLVVSIPLWFITTPFAMVFAATAANDFNRRNGIVVH